MANIRVKEVDGGDVVYVHLEPGQRCVVAVGEHRVWVRGPSLVPNIRTMHPVVGIMPDKGYEAQRLPSRVDEAPVMFEIAKASAGT